MKKKNNLLETLKPVAKRACPVMPPSKLDEWQSGVYVGQARGVHLVVNTLTDGGFLTEEEQDALVALITNSSDEEIKAQRAQAEEHNKEMAELDRQQKEMEALEEQQRNEQE